jgi:hypothetical protein
MATATMQCNANLAKRDLPPLASINHCEGHKMHTAPPPLHDKKRMESVAMENQHK